jgi:predicted RNA-binding Zn-ribbon protein involved in translation (DUF1610 family)
MICIHSIGMNLGKMKRVHIKCPVCGKVAILDRATVRNALLVYECFTCKLKFRVPKNWKEIILTKK